MFRESRIKSKSGVNIVSHIPVQRILLESDAPFIAECKNEYTIDFNNVIYNSKSDGIEVRVQDGDVWLTQNAIAQLFDIDRSVVSKHLKKIFSSGELDENSVCAKYAQTADDGKNYNYKFYSLAGMT